MIALLAIKFSLDSYTNWWNSPQAALYFWLGFFAFVAVCGGLIYYFLMRAGSAK